MKIILLEDQKGLGNKGDIVEVNEGFARNFLFPQHKAIEATEAKMREMKEQEASQKRKEKREVKEERMLASQIDGLELEIAAKASEGSLYAAITVTDIARALKEHEIKVPKKLIQFKPVKELGTYPVTVAFPSGFDAELTVTIIEA
jgi:large subunit ribosomal protein L9